MIKKRWMLMVAVVGVAAACDKKPAVPADSTLAADTMSARNSVADSAAALRDSAAMTKVPPIVGHDSAFGPIGMVDSTGKVIPIRPRRP